MVLFLSSIWLFVIWVLISLTNRKQSHIYDVY